jgi:hypothetical protein
MLLGDQLLALAAQSSPAIGETIRRYGDRPLRDLLASLRPSPVDGLQPLDDVVTAVEAEAAAHFGAGVAARVAAEVRADPIVPTSNHFGIETVAESAQATALFALRPGRPQSSRYVVVLGFGSVSMNNWSYPMGLQLYDPRHGRIEQLPQRLPIFPGRVKQHAVCAAEPFDEQMLRRAQARLWRMARSGAVSPFGARAAGEVLDMLTTPAMLAPASYSAQSPLVNAELWRRMFGSWRAGELIQLQMERVCARVLQHDLDDPNSLVHRLFFVDQVRERLLDVLDGALACWRRAELARRLDEPEPGWHRSGGTTFFWGLTEAGRRVPLTVRRAGRTSLLAGVDDRGRGWRVELSPGGIRHELEGGRLLPSLFTCFVVTALARGLSCIGGYYQAEYLPAMQAGVAHALAGSADHRDAAGLVARVPTRICLAGVQGLVRELEGGAVVPAGPVELAGMGGVGDRELADVTAMPVRQACLIAFTELFDVLVPGADLPPGWAGRLARENAQRRRRSWQPPADRANASPGTRIGTTPESDITRRSHHADQEV